MCCTAASSWSLVPCVLARPIWPASGPRSANFVRTTAGSSTPARWSMSRRMEALGRSGAWSGTAISSAPSARMGSTQRNGGVSPMSAKRVPLPVPSSQ